MFLFKSDRHFSEAPAPLLSHSLHPTPAPPSSSPAPQPSREVRAAIQARCRFQSVGPRLTVKVRGQTSEAASEDRWLSISRTGGRQGRHNQAERQTNNSNNKDNFKVEPQTLERKVSRP